MRVFNDIGRLDHRRHESLFPTSPSESNKKAPLNHDQTHQANKAANPKASDITLLDYRPDAKAATGENVQPHRKSRKKSILKPILVIPSLINRSYILDLSEQNSFMRHLGEKLSDQGYAPFLLDWGAPGPIEYQYNLADYVKIPLSQALKTLTDWSRDGNADHGTQPITVIGYCMGGVLALALALRNPQVIKNLVLLATPWNFHADSALRPTHGRQSAVDKNADGAVVTAWNGLARQYDSFLVFCD